jgi:hypothetical protein
MRPPTRPTLSWVPTGGGDLRRLWSASSRIWGAHVQRRWLRSYRAVGALLILLSASLVACAPAIRQSSATGSAVATQGGSAPPVGLEVGQRLPDFAVKALDGKPVSGTDLLAQDKPFILYFFATW